MLAFDTARQMRMQRKRSSGNSESMFSLPLRAFIGGEEKQIAILDIGSSACERAL